MESAATRVDYGKQQTKPAVAQMGFPRATSPPRKRGTWRREAETRTAQRRRTPNHRLCRWKAACRSRATSCGASGYDTHAGEKPPKPKRRTRRHKKPRLVPLNSRARRFGFTGNQGLYCFGTTNVWLSRMTRKTKVVLLDFRHQLYQHDC